MNGAATQGRLQVDLESLAFSEEGHFMSNRKVNLPPGSQRNSFKVFSPAHKMPILQLALALHVPSIVHPDACGRIAYRSGQAASMSIYVKMSLREDSLAAASQEHEEIVVPASKPPASKKGERAIQITELPDWMHPVFEGMKKLMGILVLLQEYEEILVPASKPPAFQAGERLIQISELPDWMHPAFEGMKELNRIQSRVSQTALYTAENILMCAPTGAGKTNVAMLTILQEVCPLWALLGCCTVYPFSLGDLGADGGIARRVLRWYP